MPRSIRSKEFARNYGFWSEAEQSALMDARVAIGGAGGGGFQLGLKLARMGVGAFSIADPEVFEPENVNRVEGARISNMGRNKAEVFREQLLDINPDADVTVFPEGVSPDTVEDFLRGASLVLDESDSTTPYVGAMIARQARAQGIPDVLAMNIGFAAQVTSFPPTGPWTFERFHGISPTARLADIVDATMDLTRSLPYIPRYADLRSLNSIRSGGSDSVAVPLPSLSIGVDALSAIASTQVFLHLTAKLSNHRRSPTWAPAVAYIDTYTFQAGILRGGRGSHYRHLIAAALWQRRNPQASYTVEEIGRRLADAHHPVADVPAPVRGRHRSD
ncbi:MAG: ThiF family adenylyltransferase [Microbacteriaceae bacterium]